MEFNLMSTDTIYPNINIVFDDSLYAVSDDKDFICSVGQRFNSNITFPSYADSIKIGGSPTSFNYPIAIPNSVKNVSNLFAKCSVFNQPITLNSNISNVANMFNMAYNFNSTVTVSDGISSLAGLFDCYTISSKYNKPIDIPNSVTNCFRMFYNCASFNCPINIPENVIDYSTMFYQCSLFNQPVNISKANNQVVSNAFMMFGYCSNFNQIVNMPDSTIITSLFHSCTNYNQPFIIPNNVTSIQETFRGCVFLNQAINVPNSVNIASYAFFQCRNLNQKINFEDNVVNGFYVRTFEQCYTFNQNVVFPNGTNRLEATFCNDSLFNAIVVIPPTTVNTYQMFWNVNSYEYNMANSRWNTTPSYNALRQPIYFFANNIAIGGAQQMFYGCNSMSELYIIGLTNNYQLNMFIRNNGINRCNIYTDDDSQALLITTPILVNGGKPTWSTDATNGCKYNTTMNLYIYNNWDGTVPSGI